MIGSGIARGLAVTLRHLIQVLGSGSAIRRSTGNQVVRQNPDAGSHGVFTVQYPEQKLAVPERYRSFPILLYEDETGAGRCTSCGICAKVCPPQCIWIVRSAGPDGKPIPQPAEFIIDQSICMSCGLCAEYCPFDAIKMDHDYELAKPERRRAFLAHQVDLRRPVSYHARIHPTDYADEEAERLAKEEADRVKESARAARPAKSA